MLTRFGLVEQREALIHHGAPLITMAELRLDSEIIGNFSRCFSTKLTYVHAYTSQLFVGLGIKSEFSQ